MNILRHKSWHVRTKENMARVRRDEAKAAAEEAAKAERVKLAEQEDRINRLKRNAGVPTDDPLALSSAEYEKHAASSGHVNFFAEIEAQERTNFAAGNAEYQKEKRAEHHEWESKMGIMKRFAEDTHDLSSETHWWQTIDRAKPDDPEAKSKEEEQEGRKPKEKMRKSEKELKRELKRQLKAERKAKKKRKRRRHSSSSSSSSDDDRREAKKKRLEQLRAERLERERAEQRRTRELLNPTPNPEPSQATSSSNSQPKQRPTYSAQFNPEFFNKK